MRIRLCVVAAVTAALMQPLTLAVEARGAPPAYRIEPSQSVVRFSVTKLGFEDVVGTFRESSGEIRWDPSQPEAGFVRWRVRVASIQSDARNRDRALQGPDYFDGERHPELIFESTQVRALDAGRLEVHGRLTMRGHTRPQTLLVRHSGSADAPVFETDFTVDRYNFGIAGGSVMGRLIGRTVRVHLRAVTREHTS